MRVLIILFFSLLPLTLWSQDEYSLLDLNSDKSLKYVEKNLNLKEPKANIYEEIYLAYPVFIAIKDKNIEAKINERIKEIALKQITTDSFKTKVKTNHKAILEFQHKAENDQYYREEDEYGEEEDNTDEDEEEDYYYERPVHRDYPIDIPNEFSLTDVGFQFLSYSDPIIAIKVDFTYNVKAVNNDDPDKYGYNEIYYFNINTGKEYHAEQIFKNISDQNFTSLIENKFLEMLNKGKDSNKKSGKKKESYSFNIANGSYLWFTLNSFKFECMNSVTGDEFTLNVPLNEIKPYLNTAGPYGHLISFNPPVYTAYKNLNHPDYQEMGSARMFNSVAVIDGVPENFAYKKFKEINILRVVEKTNQEKTEVLTKKYIFNEKGLLKEIQTYDEWRLYGKVIFEYNKNNLISKRTRWSANDFNSETTYEYDINGNLIKEKTFQKDEDPSIVTYTYGKNYFDEEGSNFSSRSYLDAKGNVIKKFSSFSDYNLNYSQTIYKYDAFSKILGSYSGKESLLRGTLYAYNTQGKLMSVEYDNQRYRMEYQYDAAGNLIEAMSYDYNSGGRNLTVQYKDNLPVKYEDFRYGNKMEYVIYYKY